MYREKSIYLFYLFLFSLIIERCMKTVDEFFEVILDAIDTIVMSLQFLKVILGYGPMAMKYRHFRNVSSLSCILSIRISYSGDY